MLKRLRFFTRHNNGLAQEGHQVEKQLTGLSSNVTDLLSDLHRLAVAVSALWSSGVRLLRNLGPRPLHLLHGSYEAQTGRTQSLQLKSAVSMLMTSDQKSDVPQS